MRDRTFREGLENPEPLDAERVTGAFPEVAEDEASPLDAVAGAEIKFLLAGEARRLAPVDAHPLLLPRFARSVLRDASFGQTQGRISQGLRTDPAAARELVSAPPAVGYEDEAAAFEKLLAHLEDLIAAAAAVLVEGAVAPDVAERGRRALKSIRRRGFDGLRAGAPEAIEALREAAPAIVALKDRLSPFCARLRAGRPWTARQEEDEAVFRAQFARIYGEETMP